MEILLVCINKEKTKVTEINNNNNKNNNKSYHLRFKLFGDPRSFAVKNSELFATLLKILIFFKGIVATSYI